VPTIDCHACSAMPCLHKPEDQTLHLPRCTAVTPLVLPPQGFSVFGSILRWFQARNNWGGWGIFLGMYLVVVALFLPGVLLIMGAGFIFGCALLRWGWFLCVCGI
jgi:hypothetical protein